MSGLAFPLFSSSRTFRSSPNFSLLLFRQIHIYAVVLRHDLRSRQSGFAFTKRPVRPWGSRAYPCVDERARRFSWGSLYTSCRLSIQYEASARWRATATIALPCILLLFLTRSYN